MLKHKMSAKLPSLQCFFANCNNALQKYNVNGNIIFTEFRINTTILFF